MRPPFQLLALPAVMLAAEGERDLSRLVTVAGGGGR
jgi:hypothetical protein